MKQIILLATYLPVDNLTLTQYAILASNAWIMHKIQENSIKNVSYPYDKFPTYKSIPKFGKGYQENNIIPVQYLNNELHEMAEQAREQGREYFYTKKIEEQGYGTRYIEIFEKEIEFQYDIGFSLSKEMFEQYIDKSLFPLVYQTTSGWELKDAVLTAIDLGLNYEEDWIDFWHNDERIAVGFRPLADEVADEITEGLELL